MATEYIEIEGKVQYPQLYEPDNAFGASNYKLNIFPKDDAEWAKIKKAGIQKKIQENNDPERGPVGKYIQFTRAAFKVIKGEMVNFSGPVVLNHEGKVIVDYINSETEKRVYSFPAKDKSKVYRRGKPVLIGNGSDVKIRVAVYDTQKGKGQRLESVTVLNLVEFVRQEKELPPVLEDVRTPLEPIDTSSGSKILDDEIPF